MKTIKGKGRKLLAAALSLLMLVGLLPVSAFAAGSSVTVTFAYLYQSDGSQIMYQDTFVGTHAVNGGAGHPAVQIYADGEEAYCIEPGEHLLTGDVLTENASEAWNSLGSAKQEAIKMALAFGKPGNAGGLIGSGDAKHLATQMIVWEFVCGYRDAASYALLDNCIYNAFCKNGANAEVAASYNAIAQAIRNWDVTPSFANGRTYEMSYENGKYVVSLNDSNGVLGSFSVMSSDSNVKISKAGNTLTLTCDSYLDAEPTITVQKSSNISASAVLISYGSPNLQDIVVGMARIEDVSASFKVSTVGGTLKLVKNSEDGIVDGIEFTITGSGYNKVVTSGRDGTVSLEGLVPGTYTISEAPASYYEPQEAKNVTIVSGETATVTFNNTLKRGSLSVSKTSEDGFTEGMKFRLSGVSASGSVVDLYATTDSTGVATFNDVLIAGVGGYTLEEVDTAVRYVIPEDQNVTVTWKDMTGATVNNVLKKFDVTVVKSDAETGAAQGDATLAGAVYGLYQDGTLVKEYMTDAAGSFTTDYFVCGDNWIIKEITPSEGYLLDETEYHVGAEPESYEIELNHAPALSSYEQVIKGNISIIKHSDDGSTQIETPEVGASFEVYLTSAGSYENAKESERDNLICDENGFAQTKELPYGLYTVHQTAGNPDTEFMKDFTVFISENGKTYRFLINNAPYTAYIKVVKADAETGNAIPLTGAGFEIYDGNGDKITMSYTYPTLTTIDTFYVSEDGYLITPQKLSAGSYQLVEVQAPYGYVLNSTPIDFTVTSSENEDLEGLCVITVTAYDMAQKGKISITKSGEVFASVNVTGEEGVVDKEGTWGIINPIYSAVYELRNLAGASYRAVRKLSDLICAEHRLSVIENPQKHGLSYNKWLGVHDKLTNRDLLRMAIDAALEKKPKDFDAFLALLKSSGYTVSRKGRLSLRHENQKQSIRLDSLGEGYSELELRAVLAGSKTHNPFVKKKYPKRKERTTLISEIEANLNSGKGYWYDQTMKVVKLKQMAKTLVYLEEQGFADFEALANAATTAEERFYKLKGTIKTAEARMSEIQTLRTHIINYSKTREVYAGYRKAGYSKKYLAEHESDILIHKAAKKAFDDFGLKKLPTVKSLNEEFARLLTEKKAAYADYHKTQEQMRELMIHKANAAYLLGLEEQKQRTHEHQREEK